MIFIHPSIFFSITSSQRIKQVFTVQFSSVMSDSLRPHESQHTRPPCPSPTPGVHSNSCPSSRWCHPAISSSVIPFSSCPQSLPASGAFPMSQLHMRWPKYWLSMVIFLMICFCCFASRPLKYIRAPAQHFFGNLSTQCDLIEDAPPTKMPCQLRCPLCWPNPWEDDINYNATDEALG